MTKNLDTLAITEFSLAEFLKVIQEAVLAGWRLDFEDNLRYPTVNFSGAYNCTIVLPASEEDETEEIETIEIVKVPNGVEVVKKTRTVKKVI